MLRIERVTSKLYKFRPSSVGISPVPTSEALLSEALAREKSGDVAGACKLYLDIAASDPDNAQAWVNIGLLYAADHDLPTAEDCFREAIEIEPECALTRFNLAVILEGRRKKYEAIESYKEAIHIDPRCADAHYNLAVTYKSIRNGQEALKHFILYQKWQRDDRRCFVRAASKAIAELRAQGFDNVVSIA